MNINESTFPRAMEQYVRIVDAADRLEEFVGVESNKCPFKLSDMDTETANNLCILLQELHDALKPYRIAKKMANEVLSIPLKTN